MQAGAETGGRSFLNKLQVDHLAGNLGKPFESRLDRNISGRVNRNHVTGRIPTVNRTESLFIKQVTFHQIGAANHQIATAVNARHRIQPPLDSRQKFSDRTATRGQRRIQTEHRPCFGYAIAFENSNPELVQPQITNRLPQLLASRQ